MTRRRKRRAASSEPAAANTNSAPPLDAPPASPTRSWLLPESGDLLRDVAHLQACLARAEEPEMRGVFARAAVVMGMAAIEAATNHALAAVAEVMRDKPPPDRAKTPPWRYFSGRSKRRVASLLRHGKFGSKRTYVLWQIERVIGKVPDESLTQAIDRLRHVRNRIVHSNYRHRPEGEVVGEDDAQALAATAADCARRYRDFLKRGFAALALPLGAAGDEAPAA
ncbi:MAG TPA: hypothetical protein VFO61_05910 [Alphaproteobacteria bacterium]|nr:hypothetical protein [Alphaproteobacteria bacterium]